MLEAVACKFFKSIVFTDRELLPGEGVGRPGLQLA